MNKQREGGGRGGSGWERMGGRGREGEGEREGVREKRRRERREERWMIARWILYDNYSRLFVETQFRVI